MRKLIIFLFILFSFNINSDIGSELKNIENWYAIDLEGAFLVNFIFMNMHLKMKILLNKKLKFILDLQVIKKMNVLLKKMTIFLM